MADQPDQKIILPNGDNLLFPAGMSEADMQSAIGDAYPEYKPSSRSTLSTFAQAASDFVKPYLPGAEDQQAALARANQNTRQQIADNRAPSPDFQTPQFPPSATEFAPSYLDQAKEALGIKPTRNERAIAQAGIQHTLDTPENANSPTTVEQARQAVGGMSPIPAQVAGGAINTATGGILPDNSPIPSTPTQEVASGLGKLGGFLVGAPLKVAQVGVDRAIGQLIAKGVDDSFAKALGKSVLHQSAVLGTASGLSAVKPALDQNSMGGAASTIGEAAKGGAELGAVYGVPQGFPVGGVANKVARILGTNVAVDLLQGTNPLDSRSIEQKVFDYGLNTWFSLAGRPAPKSIHQELAGVLSPQPDQPSPIHPDHKSAFDEYLAQPFEGTAKAPIKVETPQDIAQAVQRVDTNPSEAQKEAGNFTKGHIDWNGLKVTIENPAGSLRSGISPEGPWQVRMPHHYGYVKETLAIDGDQHDVYVGPNVGSPNVFIVDQIDPKTGKFDEHKSMLGFDSAQEATQGYEGGFSDGSGPSRMGAITEVSLPDFKDWLKSGDTKKPVTYTKKAQLQGGQNVGGEITPTSPGIPAGSAQTEHPIDGRAGAPVVPGNAESVNSGRPLVPDTAQAVPQVGAGEAAGAGGTNPALDHRQAQVPVAADHRTGERRQDVPERKHVADMTHEELRYALLTDHLTDTNNRRAYEDAQKLPIQASVDVDGLKWVNDNLGHAAGDELLKTVARALKEQTGETYHISGDEFVVQGRTQREVNVALKAAQKALKDAKLEATDQAGNHTQMNGVGFSYGLGKTLAVAEEGLHANKAAREQQGLRAARGEAPKGVVRTPTKEAAPEKKVSEVAKPNKPVEVQNVAKPEKQTKPVQPPKEVAPVALSEVKSGGLQDIRPQIETLLKRVTPAKSTVGKKLDIRSVIERAKELMNGTREPSAADVSFFNRHAKRAEGDRRNPKTGAPEPLEPISAEAMRKLAKITKDALPKEGDVAPVEIQKSANKVTETPAFKRWFGESKVVSEDGSPKVMYHGTVAKTDFATFKAGDGELGKGIYVAADSEHAGTWARGANARILPVFVHADQLFDYGAFHRAGELDGQQVAGKSDRVSNIFRTIASRIQADPSRLPETAKGWLSVSPEKYGAYIRENSRDLNAWLRLAGYDGAFDKGSQVPSQIVVFNRSDIKSTIGNNGKFSSVNGSIVKSQAPAGEEATFSQQRTHTPEKALAAIQKDHPGWAKPLQKLIDRGTRGERGGIVLGSQESNIKIAAEQIAKQRGVSVEKLLEKIRNEVQPDGTITDGFYSPELGISFINTDKASPKELTGVLLHEILHQTATDEKTIALGQEVLKRIGVTDQKSPVGLVQKSASKITDTPAFKRWFGDSKVVDSEGKPLIVYHGTGEQGLKGNEFKSTLLGSVTKSRSAKAGFFFVDDKQTARGYSDLANAKPVQDLIDASQRAERSRQWDRANALMVKAEKLERTSDPKQHVVEAYLSLKNPFVFDAGGERFLDIQDEIHNAIAEAGKGGYDGLIIKDLIDNADWGSDRTATHYVAFEPTQIKSAIGNSGEFSSTNPSILKSVAPTFYSALERTIPDMKKIAAKDGTINVEQGTSAGHDIYARVRERMAQAGETGNANEAANYLVEEAMKMGSQAGHSYLDHGFWAWAQKALPRTAILTIKRWLAAVRAMLYKRGLIVKVEDLRVDDIAAIAVSNMKELAAGKREAAGGKSVIAGSQAAALKVEHPQIAASSKPSDQTQTPAFKRWFGDSKVVDLKGKPLVVYHGSRNAGFTTFDSGTAYFSNRWDIAASYGGMDLVGEGIEYNGSNPGQYETYLKAENPMIIDWGGKDWGDGPEGLKLDDMAARAKNLGHDGLIAENVADTGWFNPGAVSDKGLGAVYAVFKPTQIKSATGNNGDFNPENPSILFSKKSRLLHQDEPAPEDAVTTLSHLQEAKRVIVDNAKKLVDTYTNHLAVADTEIDKIIGKLTGDAQITDQDLTNAAKALTKEIPEERRAAMVHYVNAGGDLAVLKDRAAKVPNQFRKAFEDAQTLTSREKSVADNIRKQQEDMGVIAVDHGVLSGVVENYVRGQWERVTPVGQQLMAVSNSGLLNDHPREAMQKVFDTYYDGIMAGAVPKNMDIAYQFVAGQRSIRRALAAREALAQLMGAKAPDGHPIVAVGGLGSLAPEGSEQPYFVKPNVHTDEAYAEDGRPYMSIDHPALRKWKWVGSDNAGKPIMMEGNMLIHPDAYGRLNAILGRDWVREYEIGQGVPFIGGMRPVQEFLNASAYIKSTILSGVPFSPFHQVALGLHSVFHLTNPFNLPEIDFKKRPLLKEGVYSGLMLVNHNAMQEFGEGFVGGGLFSGIPFSKHITKSSKTIPWPVISSLQTRYGHYLFQDIIPRYKAATYENALARAEKFYAKDLASGKMTRAQLTHNVAKQVNAMFGEQNYKYMGRNKGLHSFIRTIAFAPDFLESRARSIGQAMRPKGLEQIGGLLIGIGAMSFVAQSLNLMFGDKKEINWKKPLTFTYNGRDYSIRSEVGDVYHLLTNPRSFFIYRLNPLLGDAYDLITGRNKQGEKVDFQTGLKDIFESSVPIQAQGLVGHQRDISRAELLLDSFLQSSGITNYVSKTDAERLISDFHYAKLPSGGYTAAQEELFSAKINLERDYMAGRIVDIKDLKQTAQQRGIKLTKQDEWRIYYSREKGPAADEYHREKAISPLDHAELQHVWVAMSKEEQDSWYTAFYNKVKRSHFTFAQKQELWKMIGAYDKAKNSRSVTPSSGRAGEGSAVQP